ncbi:MAG: transglutaminase-like cysteine peptidase [Deferribacterales bacterium]|jgi:predicted transglutaminase-like cysteine proteinase
MVKHKGLVAFILLILLGSVCIGAHSSFYLPEAEMKAYGGKYGDMAVTRLNGLLTLMDSLLAEAEDKQVIQVNAFYNQLPYKSDTQTWGKKDYWASRLEFLGVGQGDCEDYAVAKFLTLLQLGVPQEKLFLTYVKAKGYADEAHMVVTYYKKPGTVPFVLDNYVKQIMPATKRDDLVPIYSFTANDLFLQKQKGLGKRVDPSQSKNVDRLKSVDLEILKR